MEEVCARFGSVEVEHRQRSRRCCEVVEVVAKFFEGVGTVDFGVWSGEDSGWWGDRVEFDGDTKKGLAVGKLGGFKLLGVNVGGDAASLEELDEFPRC